jgi:hypothetical protein
MHRIVCQTRRAFSKACGWEEDHSSNHQGDTDDPRKNRRIPSLAFYRSDKIAFAWRSHR